MGARPRGGEPVFPREDADGELAGVSRLSPTWTRRLKTCGYGREGLDLEGDETAADGEGDGLGATGGAKLTEDGPDVELHRVLADM